MKRGSTAVWPHPDDPRPLPRVAARQLDSWHWGGFLPEQIEYGGEDPKICESYAVECVRNGAGVVLPRPE